MNIHLVSANNSFFIQKDEVVYMFHLQSLCASKWLPSKGQNVSPQGSQRAQSMSDLSQASDTVGGHRARGKIPYPTEVQLVIQKSPCHQKHKGTCPRKRTLSCLSKPPNHSRHYQHFCNRQHSQIPLLLDTTHQSSFYLVSPPFKLVEVPDALALLSLVGGRTGEQERHQSSETDLHLKPSLIVKYSLFPIQGCLGMNKAGRKN